MTMKKILLLLCLLCSFNLSAQILPKDSVATSKDDAQKVSTSKDKMSWMLRCHLLEAIESEYDYICEDNSSDFVIAQRSNEYWKIDLETGEESRIDYVVKERYRDSSDEEEQSSATSAYDDNLDE